MLTRDQQYSSAAYEKMIAIKNVKSEADVKAYGSMSHKLPILIRTAGLSQALAFVDARGKEIQRALLDDLAKTIEQENRETFLRNARQAPL